MPSRDRRWMPNAKLRALAELGWTYADIARANEDATGYRPAPSTVNRKLQKLGVAPRKISHKDLIWWRVRPEHWHDPIYYGLQAIDRERKGAELTSQDRYRAQTLKDLLTARGGPFVVDYRPDIYPERGWTIIPARPNDTDIVVRPPDQDHNHIRDSPDSPEVSQT